MKIEKIMGETCEEKQVQMIYEYFHEDSRLTFSRAASVEFLTTVSFIDRYLKPDMKILDIGAGAGAYSIHYAKQGYAVEAVELSERNISDFREKITDDLSVHVRQGNALDLSMFDDDSFDIVLLMGPLYHLHNTEDRSKCIEEAKRVCRKDGILFISFISHDMVFMSELRYDPHYFRHGDFDKDTLRLHDFPFVFFTTDECRDMLDGNNLQIIHAVASDGSAELMQDEINAMDDEEFELFMRYHFMMCEKPEQLGFSNHLLYICGQNGESYV